MAAGSSTVSLTGLSSAIAPSFSFAICRTSALIGFENEIPVDDHAHRKPRPDRQRRLDVQIAANDLLAGLIDALGRARTQSPDESALVVLRTGFRSNAEQGREDRCLEQHAPMVVHVVL